ncbi:DoxX family protein [Leucobacter musarum]|uniref:DoxX family protein n=1 Tax=Leucobacter musarum TaxID=1930747 RepID=UPI0006A7F031|nr:DoxX family protein [Leucobacter musarum]
MPRQSASTANATSVSWGILVIRIALGVVFTAHGAQKLFEYTLAGTVESFGSIGAPLPEITAPLVAFLEFGGGILLIAGLFTRLVAILLAIDMVVAIALVHAQAGFWVGEGGYEFVALLGAAALGLAFAGAGRISLDGAVLRGRIPAWVA